MRPQAIPSLANFIEFVMQFIAAILYNVRIKFNIIKFDRQQVYVIQYVTASNCKPFSFVFAMQRIAQSLGIDFTVPLKIFI